MIRKEIVDEVKNVSHPSKMRVAFKAFLDWLEIIPDPQAAKRHGYTKAA